MTGKERILTALDVKEPDRVPLYIHGINEAPIIGIGKHLTQGLPEPQFFRNMEVGDKMKLLDTLFLIHESFGVDGFTSFEIGHETTVDDMHVKDDFGVTYQLSEYGIPVAVDHPIKDMDALKNFTPPVPDRSHLTLLDLAKARFANEKAIFWLMRGTFVRSWRLTGMENLMFKMFDAPDFVHEIARITMEYNLAQLEMLAEAGLDVLVIEDDIAGANGPLISPGYFAEFVNAYNRRIVEKAHEKGLKVVRHSDGNLWKLMDTLLDTGYDGLNPLEPQADMAMKKVKDECGDKICLIGNIDCVDLLPNGTPEQVDEAVASAIKDAGAGGGLIISSSNSLHPGVNPENCIAMFESTKKHGKY
jgi:uroporphyrinogen decarboxylase